MFKNAIHENYKKVNKNTKRININKIVRIIEIFPRLKKNISKIATLYKISTI